LVKVKKGPVWRAINPASSEPYEEFDRKKIEMALVRAGVRGPNVEQIAALVKPYEGMTTDEIDRIVVAALEERDQNQRNAGRPSATMIEADSQSRSCCS